MAKNFTPEVQAAKRVAEEFGYKSVIVLGFRADARIAGASYGQDKRLCELTGRVLEETVGEYEKGEWDSILELAEEIRDPL